MLDARDVAAGEAEAKANEAEPSGGCESTVSGAEAGGEHEASEVDSCSLCATAVECLRIILVSRVIF